MERLSLSVSVRPRDLRRVNELVDELRERARRELADAAQVTRPGVLRAIVERGLAELERELQRDQAAAAPPAKARPRLRLITNNDPHDQAGDVGQEVPGA